MNLPVEFLQKLRPGGPWVLTAIVPDGATETISISSAEAVTAFVGRCEGTRNVYYSVNPTRTILTKKAAKTDIAAIEFALADLDPADGETPEQAKQRYLDQLNSFEPKPTAVVDSGNGIQVLWRLIEPIILGEPVKDKNGKIVFAPEDLKKIADAETRIEAVMKRLGAKAGTQNIDRILRLPGTTNLPNAKKRKEGRVPCPTRLIYLNGAACRLDAFPSPPHAAGENAQPRGAAGSVELPANLLSLLYLTEAGAYPSRSELLFAFITGALRKGVADDRIAAACEGDQYAGCAIYEHCLEKGGRDYIASQIAHARGKKPEGFILDPFDPMKSARALVSHSFIHYGLRTLHRHRGAFWLWTGSHYALIDDEAIAAKVWNFLDSAVCLKDDQAVPFKPTGRKVNDVVAALVAETQLDRRLEPPVWLTRKNMPKADSLYACRNGLLCLASGQMYEPSADFFNVCASEVLYDPNAATPTEWLKFLGEIFENDTQSILLQQEWFGYVLSSNTSQQKMLLEIGPRRSGKGTKARVLRVLLGWDSVAGPTISDLQTQFGVEPLITKSLAIISDARIGKRTDKSAIVERLLSISGEDTMTVPRKFKRAWTGRLPTRIVILTNEIPALTEGSGALAGRLMILITKQSFFGREDPGLTEKLSAEASGILNWAIAGYRSLMKRGHFVQPDSSKELEEQIELLAAPIKAFLLDCCVVGPGFEIKVDDLWSAYVNWCFSERKNPGDKAWFGRNLAAAVPGLGRTRPCEGAQRPWTYSGLQLLPGAAQVQAAKAVKAEREEPM